MRSARLCTWSVGRRFLRSASINIAGRLASLLYFCKCRYKSSVDGIAIVSLSSVFLIGSSSEKQKVGEYALVAPKYPTLVHSLSSDTMVCCSASPYISDYVLSSKLPTQACTTSVGNFVICAILASAACKFWSTLGSYRHWSIPGILRFLSVPAGSLGFWEPAWISLRKLHWVCSFRPFQWYSTLHIWQWMARQILTITWLKTSLLCMVIWSLFPAFCQQSCEFSDRIWVSKTPMSKVYLYPPGQMKAWRALVWRELPASRGTDLKNKNGLVSSVISSEMALTGLS